MHRSRRLGRSLELDRAVKGWLDDAGAVAADLTYTNDNVTYEIGYAVGARKNLRLIRNPTVDVSDLKELPGAAWRT